MKIINKHCFMLILIVMFVTVQGSAKSLWQDKNIYSAAESLKVGDILIVKVEDISQMKFTMSLTSKSSFNITANPDANITGFLPKVSSNKKSTNSDKTNFSGKGNLSISIAATITKKIKDGKYQISGIREYSLNGINSRFTVSGDVKPSLVRGQYIMSYNIANFRLEIKGRKEGLAIDLKREKLKEGANASAQLTEEEKQKIILDYLKKMMGELTR